MSDEHGGHVKAGIFRTYVWSTNHKMIGKQFLITSFAFLFIAGFLALSLRWQLAKPGKPVPLLGRYIFGTAAQRADLPDAEKKVADAKRAPLDIAEAQKELAGARDADAKAKAQEKLDDAKKRADPAYLAKAQENLENAKKRAETVGAVNDKQFVMLTTMHGSLMIFFVIIPILVGAFGNFLIPLHVGTHDMAFPILNAGSYWVFWLACVFALVGFTLDDGAAASGWTMYSTLSEISGPGQTLWLIALTLVGFSSIMGAVNYLTTILKMRAPGLSMWRLPLTTWAQFITAVLQLLATPVLAGALIMLSCDRLLGTHFFTPGGLMATYVPQPHSGGNVLLWQHVFWFYSHPAVYILVLPAMGMASDLLAVGARKAIFGYKAMVYSITAIAGLGFIVWAHHMFMSGMKPGLGTAFMISTMMIALPSAIKVFNWLGTLWRGSIRFDVPTLNALSFVSMFIIGGLSGIFMAATPVDIFIHDTYYIVAHFHYVVFGGSLFAVFGAVFFWFPKMFGRMMNPLLGKIHWALSFLFFNLVFFPMHIIGAGGHMRRVQIGDYDWLAPFHSWNVFITHSAIVLGFSQLIFVFNFFWSMYKGKPADANPWQANTLEWTIPSPAPEHNYHVIPEVHNGPYEYGATEDKDYLPQTEKSGNLPAAH